MEGYAITCDVCGKTARLTSWQREASVLTRDDAGRRVDVYVPWLANKSLFGGSSDDQTLVVLTNQGAKHACSLNCFAQLALQIIGQPIANEVAR